MMLALTPGLPGAELIALAIPCSVSLLESMVTVEDAEPTLICSVPMPTVSVGHGEGTRGEILCGGEILHGERVAACHRARASRRRRGGCITQRRFEPRQRGWVCRCPESRSECVDRAGEVPNPETWASSAAD